MRIELKFDDSGIELVEELKMLTGIDSHKEFFNTTITLFDWAILQRLQGRIVASMDERKKEYKELIMPPLEYAARLRETVKLTALRKRGALVEPTSSEVAAVGKAFSAAKGGA